MADHSIDLVSIDLHRARKPIPMLLNEYLQAAGCPPADYVDLLPNDHLEVRPSLRQSGELFGCRQSI